MEATTRRKEVHAEAITDLRALQQEWNKVFSHRRSAYDQEAQLQEYQNALREEHTDLLEEDVVAVSKYAKAMAEMQHQLNRPMAQFVSESRDLWGRLESTGVGAINSLNEAWSSWLEGGKFDLEQFISGVSAEITKVTAEFLEGGLMSKFLQGGKGGEAMKGLKDAIIEGEDRTAVLQASMVTQVASATSAAVSAGTSAAIAQAALAQVVALTAVKAAGEAGAAAAEAGGAIIEAGVAHRGGITGGISDSRYVSADTFSGARSMSKGGLANGEHAIIAHDNEAIVPLSGGRKIPVQLNGGGSPSYNININVSGVQDARGLAATSSQLGQGLLSQIKRADRKRKG